MMELLFCGMIVGTIIIVLTALTLIFDVDFKLFDFLMTLGIALVLISYIGMIAVDLNQKSHDKHAEVKSERLVQ